MSHDLEQHDGQTAFVAAVETAWHRLGDFQADRLLTLNEATERAHLLNWNTHLVPAGGLLDPSDPLSWTPVPGKAAVARTNPFTGEKELFPDTTVGSGFQPIQNERVAEWAGEIMGLMDDDQHVSAAGSIMGGRRIFITLDLDGFTVLGDDRHERWLSIIVANDGSMAATAIAGATRVVCKNTADWALAGKDPRVKVRHSGDVDAKLGNAADLLGVSRDWAKAYEKMAEDLASQKMTTAQFERIIRREFVPKPKDDAGVRTVLRNERDMAYLLGTFKDAETTEVGRGTRYAALQAITQWAEWGRPGDLTTEKAQVANLFGTPVQTRAKAVKVLTGAK